MKAENKFLEPSVRRKAAGEAGQCFTLSAAYHTSHTELNCRQTCYETKMCYDIQNNLKKKTKNCRYWWYGNKPEVISDKHLWAWAVIIKENTANSSKFRSVRQVLQNHRCYPRPQGSFPSACLVKTKSAQNLHLFLFVINKHYNMCQRAAHTTGIL